MLKEMRSTWRESRTPYITLDAAYGGLWDGLAICMFAKLQLLMLLLPRDNLALMSAPGGSSTLINMLLYHSHLQWKCVLQAERHTVELREQRQIGYTGEMA